MQKLPSPSTNPINHSKNSGLISFISEGIIFKNSSKLNLRLISMEFLLYRTISFLLEISDSEKFGTYIKLSYRLTLLNNITHIYLFIKFSYILQIFLMVTMTIVDECNYAETEVGLLNNYLIKEKIFVWTISSITYFKNEFLSGQYLKKIK
jgi:hypothetical protein